MYVDNKRETRIKKIFRPCSVSAWEILMPPTEIEAIKRIWVRCPRMVTSLYFGKPNLRCLWRVLLENT